MRKTTVVLRCVKVELMWKFFTSVVRNEKDNSGAEVCESEINVEILHIFRT